MEGYAQHLRRGEGSTGADLVRPRLLDFWQVCMMSCRIVAVLQGKPYSTTPPSKCPPPLPPFLYI